MNPLRILFRSVAPKSTTGIFGVLGICIVRIGRNVDAGQGYDYTYARKVLRVYTRLKQMELRQAY